MCDSCGGCGGSTRVVYFSKFFSIPDLLTAVPPGQFHTIKYDIKEVIAEVANSRKNSGGWCCPPLKEVRMRCRFLWTPQNWNQVNAFVHFIDEVWYGTPGGTTFTSCTVGVHGFQVHGNTPLHQPYETVMTKFNGDPTSNSFAFTIYFRDFEGFQLPMSAEQLHVCLDFMLCYDDKPCPVPMLAC